MESVQRNDNETGSHAHCGRGSSQACSKCKARGAVETLSNFVGIKSNHADQMREIDGNAVYSAVRGITSLMASFSNRIYGKRSAENKRARKLEEIKQNA